jgi:SAM-dependent methyltransferase
MKKKGWWGEKRLWMFSGSFKDPTGTTVDINPAVEPDVIANCEALPFPDESFDFVMLDPPYSELEARELYNLDYCNIFKVINEASRVTRPGGTMAILHRLAPFHAPQESEHKRRMNCVAVVGVYTIAGYVNMRALTVWRKRENLDAFIPAEETEEAFDVS